MACAFRSACCPCALRSRSARTFQRKQRAPRDPIQEQTLSPNGETESKLPTGERTSRSPTMPRMTSVPISADSGPPQPKKAVRFRKWPCAIYEAGRCGRRTSGRITLLPEQQRGSSSLWRSSSKLLDRASLISVVCVVHDQARAEQGRPLAGGPLLPLWYIPFRDIPAGG